MLSMFISRLLFRLLSEAVSGIAVYTVYFGKIFSGVVLGTVTIIFMSFTLFKQTRNEDILSPIRNPSADFIKKSSSTLKRAARRDLNTLRRRKVFLKKTKFHRLINYSLSKSKKDNLILKRVYISPEKVLAQQSRTEIVIVRVPRLPGELVIQPKEH